MSLVNTFFTNEYTEVIQKLVREVVNDPKTYLGSKYLPAVALPVRKIRVEVIEASGGLTGEHVVGTAAKYTQSFGTRVQEYEPPAYKEAIHYDEAKILYLRELGNNGRNVRGVQKYIDLDIDRLNRRLEARIEKLRWDTILDGGFTYLGKTISFGFPSGNKAVPVGPLWSLDSISANPLSTPLKDLRYWLLGGYAPFRKYEISKIIMNPNTERWLLDSPDTKTFLTSYGANPMLKEYDAQAVLKLLIPGAPPVEVYKGWYQTESVDSAGKISVSDAIYFLRDGEIYFEVTNLPGNDRIGEFVEGVHLSSGSIDNPGFGKFLVVDDNTAPGTKGGPSNPYLDLLGGVYGGPKIDRVKDVLTAKVIA